MVLYVMWLLYYMWCDYCIICNVAIVLYVMWLLYYLWYSYCVICDVAIVYYMWCGYCIICDVAIVLYVMRLLYYLWYSYCVICDVAKSLYVLYAILLSMMWLWSCIWQQYHILYYGGNVLYEELAVYLIRFQFSSVCDNTLICTVMIVPVILSYYCTLYLL